jgi:hypothetical protein
MKNHCLQNFKLKVLFEKVKKEVLPKKTKKNSYVKFYKNGSFRKLVYQNQMDSWKDSLIKLFQVLQLSNDFSLICPKTTRDSHYFIITVHKTFNHMYCQYELKVIAIHDCVLIKIQNT